jgi:hypothetical protein
MKHKLVIVFHYGIDEVHLRLCATWALLRSSMAENLICQTIKLIFLIGIVGHGVQLGPFGTAATNRPIVPAPGDYDDVNL